MKGWGTGGVCSNGGVGAFNLRSVDEIIAHNDQNNFNKKQKNYFMLVHALFSLVCSKQMVFENKYEVFKKKIDIDGKVNKYQIYQQFATNYGL